jgi:DNA-damage-inducible protein D
MSQIPHTSPFDAIRHEDEHGKEYWSARELYKLLGYSRWEKFQKSIEEAKIACENSGQAVSDHFHLEVQLIAIGKSAKRKTEDYRLSRYACYLIVRAPVTGHQSQRDQRSRLLWERRLLSA